MNAINITNTNANKDKDIIVFIASSVLITMFLFFIDEGYYNFKWMADFGNWVAFIIYVVPIFLCQLLIGRFLLSRYRGPGKSIVSIALGTTIAIFVLVTFIFR